MTDPTRAQVMRATADIDAPVLVGAVIATLKEMPANARVEIFPIPGGKIRVNAEWAVVL